MKKQLFSIMCLSFTALAFAQVKDISVTAAPTVGYTWWDDHTSIENGTMVGGQLGFGFGRGIELRAIYQQSANLKSNISRITNDQNIIDKFKARDVKVTRWGGEFKGNIPTGGWLAPYLTLGSGVQTLKVEDDDKQQQIYASLGLGTKFNISDRVTFNVEGKVSAFNMDSSNTLYDRSGSSSSNSFNQWINDNTSKNNMINWSLMAGLQFYLGGRTPEEMNAVEAAYNREFGGGLRGFKFVLEPGLAYINFDDKLNLRDTYLIGGSAGFDFTEYVGVRGFYYQASKNKQITTDWDSMSLYGGDFLARLNVARGVVPYITIGGGYLNVYKSYVGKDNISGGKSGYFAKGGAGASIPLGKFIEAYGSANMLLTTDNSEDPSAVASSLRSPDQLRKSVMYTTGLRFKLGESVNGNNILNRYVNREADEKLESKNKRIAQLEGELKEAYDNNDTDKAVKIIKEKQAIEDGYYSGNSSDQEIVRMSPSQLQSLVNEVINDVENNQNKEQTTNQRIDRLERLLLEVNSNNYRAVPVQQVNPSEKNDINQKILEELKKLNDNVQKNSYEIESLNKNVQNESETAVSKGSNTTPSTNVVKSNDDQVTNTVIKDPKTGEKGVAKSILYYKGMSLFTGASFGDVTSGIFGLKAHYGFTNSMVEFVPDFALGFGKETTYGVNANILFPFNLNKGIILNPYAGLGLGLNNYGGRFRFGPNLIVGTSFNVLNGQLYVDYTARNLFDNNQIAVGYRFGF